MTGDEICLFYVVGRFDLFISEPQVGDGDATGFFESYWKYACAFCRCVTDDLDAVLVRPNGSVGAQSPEFAGTWLLRFATPAFSVKASDSPVTSS